MWCWNLVLGLVLGIWIWDLSMTYDDILDKSLEFGFGMWVLYVVYDWE